MKVLILTLLLSLIANINALAIPSSSDNGYILILNTSSLDDIRVKQIFEKLEEKLSDYNVRTDILFVPYMNDYNDIEQCRDRLLRSYQKKPKAVIMINATSWVILEPILNGPWYDVPCLLASSFDDIPIDVCGIANIVQDSLMMHVSPITKAINKRGFSIIKPLYIAQNISLMQNLNPDMEKVVLVSDNRYISHMIRLDFDSIMANQFPHLEPIHITSMNVSTSQMLDTLAHVGPNVGILYCSWTLPIESELDSYLNDNLCRIINTISTVPLYALEDVCVSEGNITGGYFVSIEDYCEAIASATNHYLKKGHWPSSANKLNPNNYFNYENIVRYKIAENKLPPLTVIYDKPEHFWNKIIHGFPLVALNALLLAIVLALVLWAYLVRRRMKKHELDILREYRDMVAKMPAVYAKIRVIRNAKGKIVDCEPLYVNKEFERMHQCKCAQIVGRPISETIKLYPNIFPIKISDIEKDIMPIVNTSAGGKTHNYERMTLKSNDSNIINVFYFETTELHRSWEKNQRLNFQNKLALRSASLGTWSVDLKRNIIHANTSCAAEQLKKLPQKMSDKELFSRVFDEDRKDVLTWWQSLLGNVDEVRSLEFRMINETKAEPFWVNAFATVSAIDNKGIPTEAVGAIAYVDDRKRIVKELIDARQKAETSDKLKSAFLANMSHEIRTPLNAIVGFSELLVTVDNNEEKAMFSKIITNNTHQLLQLISDILDLSKIEAGIIDINRAEFELNEIFEDAYSVYQYKMPAGVELKLDILPQGLKINSDKIRLNQVLCNYITNSIKFTHHGTITIGYKQVKPDWIRIYVSDTGIGIDDENQEKVFNRFIKLDDFAQGAGLGLSVCKMIALKMKGEVGVESKVNVGSTFWIEIPMKEPV